MKPYYSDCGISIYHGDCREILPAISDVDLIITDPPYQSLNASVSQGTTTRLISNAWFKTLAAHELSHLWADLRSKLPVTGALYVFADVKSGLEIFPELRPANVIVWDKCQIGMGYNWRRMHEWICFCPESKHRIRDKSAGDIIRVPGVQNKVHPTEKPVDLLAAIIKNSSDVGDIVADPFMGSGTTLLAAKQLGRQAFGVEIEESYCEIAASRLSQGILALDVAP